MQTIEQILQAAIADGMQEIILRRSAGDTWQVVAKYQGQMGGPWKVGVDADPIAAIRKAFNPPVSKYGF